MDRPTIDNRRELFAAAKRKAEDIRVQIRKHHAASLKRGGYQKHSVELEEVSLNSCPFGLLTSCYFFFFSSSRNLLIDMSRTSTRFSQICRKPLVQNKFFYKAPGNLHYKKRNYTKKGSLGVNQSFYGKF